MTAYFVSISVQSIEICGGPSNLDAGVSPNASVFLC